jgi:hypothetical protein
MARISKKQTSSGNVIRRSIGKGTVKNASYAHLIVELLHSATNTHVMHLQTRNYATHIALGEYYAAIVGLVDTLVEAIQGKYGIVKGYPMGNTFNQDMKPVRYMQYLHDMFAKERSKLPLDSEIGNIADTIAEQIDSTLYKLRFLR